MADFLPRQILCLVDLSPVSGAVLSWARLVAQRFEARLEIFHAAWAGEPKDPEVQESFGQIEMRETELYARLDEVATQSLGGLPHRINIVPGHPVSIVLQRLEKQLPDLVVLGSHGYDGLARVLLGSVAENVVRIAPCPLLIVKGSALPATQTSLGRIVCPVNFTAGAAACAEVASVVAAATGAELDLVQVSEVEGGSAEQAQRLHRWIPESVHRRSPISELVLHGEAAEQIIALLRRSSADLVVVGAEHRPFFEFTTLGRTTERLMRYSPSSVLVVPILSPS